MIRSFMLFLNHYFSESFLQERTALTLQWQQEQSSIMRQHLQQRQSEVRLCVDGNILKMTGAPWRLVDSVFNTPMWCQKASDTTFAEQCFGDDAWFCVWMCICLQLRYISAKHAADAWSSPQTIVHCTL